jgi:hypothetical protein
MNPSSKAPSSKAKTKGMSSVGFIRPMRESKARLLVLTPIAKPMNRFAPCSDPRAETGPRIAKMTKDEMIGLFKSAPMGSRHERILWAASKIAHLTGVTEGSAYRMLLLALIDAEKKTDKAENDQDVLGRTG